MKILHVTKKYPEAIGGDAYVVWNLEKQFRLQGHEVFILTSNCPEIIPGDTVLKFGLRDTPQNLDRITLKRLFSLIILFFSSFHLMKKIRPAVVHTHSEDLGFVLSLACRLYRIPLVNTCHGVSFPDPQYCFLKRWGERAFLRGAGFKKIITVDENSLTAFQRIHQKNAVYLPNGVDLQAFSPVRSSAGDRTTILFVGRLETQKGLVYLLEATRQLVNLKEDFIIHLIGEGSQEEQLKDKIAELNLEKYVRLGGKKTYTETLQFYANSDIFVLPSIWEGFPLTLLEAWAARLPVIITEVGTISRVCRNEENALVIPPRNIEKVVEALLRLMHDSSLRKRLGENGRALVEQSYSWEKVAEQVLAVYREILPPSRST